MLKIGSHQHIIVDLSKAYFVIVMNISVIRIIIVNVSSSYKNVDKPGIVHPAAVERAPRPGGQQVGHVLLSLSDKVALSHRLPSLKLNVNYLFTI